ncbi:hypothetical protein [Shewanella sp. Isolate11]|uniref:hypothetical protein n=1 Tax=Shewanella sp. Isolate11 TaxID=2908530 RepID=UPI001EFC8BCC|nr:hypothetical protein [Shewanella sp. Isolate11]MCG9697655.1 hypothetical protein [Shewanella sp. Isolate11]
MDIRLKRGKLVRWDERQQVGFIAPDDGSAEVRILGVHLFPYEYLPQEGEAIVYRQWKDSLRGTKILTGEVDLGNPIKLTSPFEPETQFNGLKKVSWQTKLSLVIVPLILANIFYLMVINYDVSDEITTKPPAGLFPAGSEYYVGKQDLSNVVFKCDARMQCLQMSSCQEAQYFTENCQGFETKVGEMPCEKLWCKSLLE